MPHQLRAVTFDVDAPSLFSLREAFPQWAVDAADGEIAACLTDARPASADLLVIGARADLTQTLGLCRGLRSQAGQAATPILVLVPPDQPTVVAAVLKAGATGCLVLPVHAKEIATMVARAHEGNQPGRHTLSLENAQREDRWRDEGGQG